MYNERTRRVLDHLEGLGLGQALVCDPMSIKYLTGYYTFPHERFFALHLSPKGTTLFCNLLFPDATGHADRVVTFADTDDPLPLVAAACDPGAPLGVDKVRALKDTFEVLGIDQSEVMSFGDAQNDLTMIKWAQVGVAMGNAVDEVKAEADYVTGDNNSDGIADALEALVPQLLA